MKNSKFGTNPDWLNKSKAQREAREMLVGVKRRCGRLLHPRNAAKLSACKSVLIGLTQTHSQPARTPMSPVIKVSYLRLRLWTLPMLFFCLGYYKLPLINAKKSSFTSAPQDKKIFLISSVLLLPIYIHLYMHCTMYCTNTFCCHCLCEKMKKKKEQKKKKHTDRTLGHFN